jgi:hypothetical protein
MSIHLEIITNFVLTSASWLPAPRGRRRRWIACHSAVQTYLLDIPRMPTKKSVSMHGARSLPRRRLSRILRTNSRESHEWPWWRLSCSRRQGARRDGCSRARGVRDRWAAEGDNTGSSGLGCSIGRAAPIRCPLRPHTEASRMSNVSARRFGLLLVAAAGLVAILAGPAQAQDDPNPGCDHDLGATDFANATCSAGSDRKLRA